MTTPIGVKRAAWLIRFAAQILELTKGYQAFARLARNLAEEIEQQVVRPDKDTAHYDPEVRRHSLPVAPRREQL